MIYIGGNKFNIPVALLLGTNFIGDEATKYFPDNIKARPKWDDVKEFLKGKMSFADLKKALGC